MTRDRAWYDQGRFEHDSEYISRLNDESEDIEEEERRLDLRRSRAELALRQFGDHLMAECE